MCIFAATILPHSGEDESKQDSQKNLLNDVSFPTRLFQIGNTNNHFTP